MSLDADAPLSSSTTVPSNPTINTSPSNSTDPLPPQPPPNTSLIRRSYVLLLRRLTSLAHGTDHNLLRLSKLLSTPSGTDALLCTTGYLLDLHSTLLTQHLARTLLPTPASSKSGEASPSSSLHTQRLTQLATGSKTLASIIADFRIFVRLWGLVGLYVWVRATFALPRLSRASTRAEKVVRGITWIQVLAGVAFQVLENGAYLASKGVFWNSGEGKRRETRWWVWSSRFWAAHVGLEMLRLGVEARAKSQMTTVVPEEKEVLEDGEKEGKLLKEARRRENRMWWRDVLSNVAYAPMTLHWSVEEGLLSELSVGVLGTIAGGTLLVDKWEDTK